MADLGLSAFRSALVHPHLAVRSRDVGTLRIGDAGCRADQCKKHRKSRVEGARWRRLAVHAAATSRFRFRMTSRVVGHTNQFAHARSRHGEYWDRYIRHRWGDAFLGDGEKKATRVPCWPVKAWRQGREASPSADSSMHCAAVGEKREKIAVTTVGHLKTNAVGFSWC